MQMPSPGREGMKSWAGGACGERLGPCVPLSVTENQGQTLKVPSSYFAGVGEGEMGRWPDPSTFKWLWG